MSAPAVTIHMATPAAEVMKIFDRGVLSALPVLDDDGRVAGVVSTTDIVRRLAAKIDDAVPASNLMSAPAIVATPSEDLDLVAWRLVAARAHRLVVVEDDRPVGILSAQDILGGLLERPVEGSVRSIMSTPVESIVLGAPISEALERLAAAGVHGLVVLDGTSPLGVFGQAEAIAARRLPPLLLEDPVEELMCNEVVSLDADTAIQRAARLAWTSKARRILVSDGGQLIGVVSDLDLVDALARAGERASPTS